MTLSRRRFLTISACFAASPSTAQATTWQGRAFGSDISITLRGPSEVTTHALAEARQIIDRMERLFSLYDDRSALARLNTMGALHAPDPDFVDLMRIADRAHGLTGGLFDPSVQPLWRAVASGQTSDTDSADRVGWHRVRFDPNHIRLDSGQQLTFNGIAQGFATDKVTEVLRALGLHEVLVNIGEYRALGGPWRLGLHDPSAGYVGQRTLRNSAIASSSPGALKLGTQFHILHPLADPKWSTVSVIAASAGLADGLSTGIVFAEREMIADLSRSNSDVFSITLVDKDGNTETL